MLIRLRDNYEWHPDEYRGWGSHIAHVALENAKRNGAKNFWEVGQATVRLFVGKKLLKKLWGRLRVLACASKVFLRSVAALGAMSFRLGRSPDQQIPPRAIDEIADSPRR